MKWFQWGSTSSEPTPTSNYPADMHDEAIGSIEDLCSIGMSAQELWQREREETELHFIDLDLEAMFGPLKGA